MDSREGVAIEICERPTGRVAEGIMSIINDLTGEWFTEDVAEATRRDLLFHDVICAWHEGRVRSFIMFTSHDGALHITLMGTSPQYRGRGLGSALMERLVTHARDLGFGEIVAFTVPPASRPAYGATVAFYQKHGFRIVQEHGELWQSGAWELRRSLPGDDRQPLGAAAE